MIRGAAILGLWFAGAFAAGAMAAGSDFDWRLPPGFPAPSVPADNPMSAAKVDLGRMLFSDPRLSVTGQHSCASCHQPERAFTDGLARSRGVTREELDLNAPALLNVAYSTSLGWRDGGVHTLEQQMRGPLLHPRELGMSGHEARLERELAADPTMARAFAVAFPDAPAPVNFDNLIRAIAAFQRTLISGDSAFDRYVFRGEHAALDASQKQGMALFFSERTKCSACHGGLNFSGADSEFADTGTGGRVRVPGLRNLARTGPYLHDGSLASLEAVLEHYETLAATGADPRLRRAPLTTWERQALRDFLHSLDGP